MLLKAGTYLGNIQKSFENSCLKVSTTVHTARKEFDYHCHENAYLSILLHGSYTEVAQDFYNKLEPGSFIFRPAHYPHANEILKEDCVCCNIELKPSFYERHSLQHTLPLRRQLYQPGEYASLDLIIHHLANDIFDYEEQCLGWLSSFSEKHARHEKAIVTSARDLLHDRHGNSTLTEIAGALFVHPIYLARVFKKATGQSVGSYGRGLRIQKSIQLLFQTSLSISAIAYELNFFDTAHFIRTFSGYYGVTPHQYRISLKKLIGYNF